METSGLFPDEITLNTLIGSFCSTKRFKQGKLIIDSVMSQPKSKIPSINTYNIFFRAILRFIVKTGTAEASNRQDRSTSGVCTQMQSSEDEENQRKEREEIIEIVDQALEDMKRISLLMDHVAKVTIIKIYATTKRYNSLENLLADAKFVSGDKANCSIALNIMLRSVIDCWTDYSDEDKLRRLSKSCVGKMKELGIVMPKKVLVSAIPLFVCGH